MGQTASASLPSSTRSSSVASVSLPPSGPRWKYDVFLSFRGEDTREGFLSHLYRELQYTRRINTFKDDKELEVGAPISPSLLKAIEESRLAVVVLSPNYASSSWCLEELRKIAQCMIDNNRILPLFYHVDPSDVRKQKGSFEEAFIKHENSLQHKNNVKYWRDALVKVASFSGWHTQNYRTERQLVEDIVEYVCNKVRPIEIEFTTSAVEFEATRQAMDKVMKALRDDNVTGIGVYGMGGVGKTTLVEQVGTQAKKCRLFDQVIMAVASQTPDTRKIQGTFADLLGLKLEEEMDFGRACRLKEKIMRGTRILIVLDDVWQRIDFSSIGIPSHNELQRCNSKVLLTTGRLSVCLSMQSHANIHLNILSEEDSWRLFVKEARKSFEKSTDFYDVASEVARECAGLPVSLIAVARALRDANLDEWKEAVQQLKASQPSDPEDEGDVFKCIKFSYDYLKSDDSKSCFLLCCLFPEDYAIPIEDLLKYGIGKGLFQDSNMQEARVTTHLVVKALKDSSLLLDADDDGCVRMHDVIRDVAILISLSKDGQRFLVKSGCELKGWPMISAHNDYSAISLMKNEIRKLPKELVCPNLQILLLQQNSDLNEIPETFFQSPNELRVLDLSHTRISFLPQSFSLLTNLQTLYLDCCWKVMDVSIFKNLKKLEILSMRCYPLKELSRDIGQLTNLRMLDVSASRFSVGHIVRIPSKVISKLHRLEELYMQCGFLYWGSQIEGEGEETNIGFDEVTGLLYLNILKVCISDAKCIPKSVEFEPSWAHFDICIGRRKEPGVSGFGPNYSRSLILDTTISTLPDWFINVVTKQTEKLQYELRKGFNGFNNILVEYDRGRLHGLKVLSVIGPNENLKELMNSITWVPKKPVFKNLEELHLEYLYGLKELSVDELPPGSLFNLKKLRIRNCHNLEVLLPSKLLQRVPNLEVLVCDGMRKMEYVFGCEGIETKQLKLRVMKLFSLLSVRSICNGPAPPAMFQTQSLYIFECEIPGSLFTSIAAQCLLQLEDLWVEKCHLLDRVIEAVNNNKKTVLPRLKNLVLRDLPRLYCGNATADIECPSLEHLYVNDCPYLLFSTSTSDYFQSRNQVQLTSYSDMFLITRYGRFVLNEIIFPFFIFIVIRDSLSPFLIFFFQSVCKIVHRFCIDSILFFLKMFWYV